MSRDDRIAAILSDWRERRVAGDPVDPEEVLAAHPDLADELRARFRALQLVELVEIVGDESESSPEDEPQRARIGEYRVIRELGRGGMGIVYEAEQVALERHVALKVLYPSISRPVNAIRRFKREARAAAQLHHTSILSVHALGEENGAWYYAMDLVRGTSLDRILSVAHALRTGDAVPASTPEQQRAATASGLLDTEASARIRYARIAESFADLAEALHVAHQAGVVHRDVKPANLLLDQDGVLHITDFGVARLMAAGQGMTQTGDIVGTPAYMSPEQARARTNELDERTDIYSLGATLYEAVTLEAPFVGEDIAELYRKIVNEEPRAPSAIDATVPRDLETIVLKSMQKSSADRYRTARMMARDLRAFAADRPITARRTPALRRAWKTVKRNRLVSGVAAAAVVATIGAVLLWWQVSSETERRVGLEYGQLLGMVREARMGRGTSSDSVDVLIARAIAADPLRPEAYASRAFLEHRPIEARLADIDLAVKRGLSPVTGHENRAAIFMNAERYADMWREFDAAKSVAKGSRPTLGEAFAAFEKGEIEKSEQVLGRIIEATSPWSPAGRETRMVRMRWREARRDFEGALLDAAELRGVPVRARLLADEMNVVRLWFRIGRAKEAERAFRKLLERTSGASDEAWRELLDEAPGYGDFRRRVLDAAEPAHGDKAWCLVERSIQVVEQDAGAAAAFAGRAVKKAPDDARGHYALGYALLVSGETASAKASLERAHECRPHDVQTVLALGSLALADGNPDRAIELADMALATRIQVRPALVLRLKATALDAKGEVDQAMELLDLADRIRPDDLETLSLRARILANARRLDEALVVLEDLSERGRPEEAGSMPHEVHMLRGDVLGRLGRTEEALREMRTALEEADAVGAEFGSAYATMLNNVGRYDEALSVSLELVEKHPVYYDAWYTAAYAFLMLGRYAEGLAALAEVFEAGRASPTTLELRAMLRFESGDLPGALEDADALIDRTPKGRVAHYVRARVLIGMRDEDRAREAFELARNRFPDFENARIHATLEYVNMLRMFGYAAEALAEIRAEKDLFASDDQSYTGWRLTVAYMLWGAGRPADAAVLARSVASTQPNNPQAVFAHAYFASVLNPDAVRAIVKQWLHAPPQLPETTPIAKQVNIELLSTLIDCAVATGLAEDAVRALERRVGEPTGLLLESWLLCLRSVGREEEAAALARASIDEDPMFDDRLLQAYVAAVAGEAERAHTLLNSAREKWEAADAFARARVHAALDELDEGIRWYESALKGGFPRGYMEDPDIRRLEKHKEWARVRERFPLD